MTAPNANWLAAMKRTPRELRTLITLWVDAYTAINFVSGTCTDQDASAALERVTPVSRAIDPVTRKMSVSELSVTLLLTPRVRAMVVAHGIIGARVEHRIGEASLALIDYEAVDPGAYVVEGMGQTETTITLRCKSIERKLAETSIVMAEIGHPLRAMRDGIILAGTPSTHYKSASFAPSAWPEIQHYMIHRFGLDAAGASSHSIDSPTKASVIVEDLLMLLNGSIITNAAGEVEFVRYDNTTTPEHWAETTDFWNLRVEGTYDLLYNAIRLGSHPKWDGNYVLRYTAADTDAQARFGIVYPAAGVAANVKALNRSTDWIVGRGRLGRRTGDPYQGSTSNWSPTQPGIGDWAAFSGPYVEGFCGAGDPEASCATLSDDMIGYVQIDNEIIAMDRSIRGNCYERIEYDDPHSGERMVRKTLHLLELRVLQRGALGTTPAAHLTATTWARDVTIQAAVCGALLPRFANGAPTIKVNTDLTKMGTRVGAMVTLTTSRFVAYGKDGLDTGTVFEVIGKRVDESAAEPSIEFTLCYAKEGTPPSATIVPGVLPGGTRDLMSEMMRSVRGDDVGNKHVKSGLGFTMGAGLAGTLGSGRTSGLLVAARLAEDMPHTFEASKDTYIGTNLEDGGIVFAPVDNNDPLPDLGDSIVWLHKVVTGADAITSVVDLRRFACIPGRSLDGTARSQHGVFGEFFEVLPGDGWRLVAGAGTMALSATGSAGGKALECTGQVWRMAPALLPYDPSKLYRMRCRVRMTARDSGSDAAKERFYCGLAGVAADGVTPVNRTGAASWGTQHYVCANNVHVYADAGSALNVWVEYTGWIQGRDAAPATGPSTDPTAPRKLHTDVRYVLPLFICNYSAGDGKMELDYIVLDVQDEDGLVRSYKGLGAAGVVNANKVVAASITANSVGAHQMLTKSARAGLGANPDFRLRNRG